MRRLTVSLAAAAGMAALAPAAAIAAEESYFVREERGAIIQLDPRHSVIVLNTGRIFQVPHEFLPGLAVGSRVTVVYTEDTDVTVRAVNLMP